MLASDSSPLGAAPSRRAVCACQDLGTRDSMDIGVFVIIVVFPALAAALAASVNSTGLITYCAMAILFVAAVTAGCLAFSNQLFSPTPQVLALAVVFLVCPSLVAFIVARLKPLRTRRLLAAVVAFVGYTVTMVGGLAAAVGLGVVKP